MFDDHKEALEWLQERPIQTQLNLISFWEEDETEPLKEQTGDFYDDFLEIAEQVKQANADSELKRDAIIDELCEEGFDIAVARHFHDAAEEIDKTPSGT